MDNDQISQTPTTSPEPALESTPSPTPEPTPEPAPEPTLESMPEPAPTTPPRKPANKLTIVVVICLILSAVGIGFGIYNIIQINNLANSFHAANTANGVQDNSDQSTNAFSGQATSASDIEYKCTPPTGADDILSISIQGSPEARFLITPNPGEIDFINYTTDETGEKVESSTMVSTDTSEIVNYAYQNTLNNLGDPDYDQVYSTGSDTLWYISLQSNTDNSECMVIGQDNPPAWFTTLVNMLEAKRNS